MNPYESPMHYCEVPVFNHEKTIHACFVAQFVCAAILITLAFVPAFRPLMDWLWNSHQFAFKAVSAAMIPGWYVPMMVAAIYADRSRNSSTSRNP